MKRLASFVVLAAVMLLAGVAAHSGADAPAAQKSGCDTIKVGEPRIFYKHNMRCSKAKSYARRVSTLRKVSLPRPPTPRSLSGPPSRRSFPASPKNVLDGSHDLPVEPSVSVLGSVTVSPPSSAW